MHFQRMSPISSMTKTDELPLSVSYTPVAIDYPGPWVKETESLRSRCYKVRSAPDSWSLLIANTHMWESAPSGTIGCRLLGLCQTPHRPSPVQGDHVCDYRTKIQRSARGLPAQFGIGPVQVAR